ncbi:hypothetical protein [Paraburkholderia bannensis]|uniref:hypothetical protein n=1 Tax=Paraburkholderia bannensis TaxID=765414 RepID=UPI000489C1EA|nr:hypothetical protein [Paraburkholderia bannensis]
MKNRLLAALIVSTTMFPMLAFAQNEHISHEQLGAPAVQAQHDSTSNPSNAAQPAHVVATSATNSGYGNATTTRSQSGSASQTASTTALYLHH